MSCLVTLSDGSTWSDEEASYPHTSNLDKLWGNFKAMEYLDIDARISHSKGALLNPEIIYHKQLVVELCVKQNESPLKLRTALEYGGIYRTNFAL